MIHDTQYDTMQNNFLIPHRSINKEDVHISGQYKHFVAPLMPCDDGQGEDKRSTVVRLWLKDGEVP